MNLEVISANSITKSFGDKKALSEIDFTIHKGEIFGFLGPSGSGKTTMINILTGQIKPDQGETYLLGKESQQLCSEDFEKIGIMSDQSGFYEKLSLEKNLFIYGKLYGVSQSKILELLKKVGLFEDRNKTADKLSTGMKQRMHLARALINNPKILFLDEPTSGLDPTTSKSIHKLLLELKNQGTTIFLTTHDMNEATLLCDYLVLLNKGKLVEQGKPKEIIQRYNINKRIRLTYEDFSERMVSFIEFQQINLKSVLNVHSCEPTLEDIFIKLTGVKLNA